MEPITGEENGPATANKSIEQEVHDSTEQAYRDFVKREQDALEAKIKGEATAKFDEVRKLGFVTKQDTEQVIKSIVAPLLQSMEEMKKEHTKTIEMLMRAKMQGVQLNSGALDQSQKETDILDKFKPAFRGADWKR